MSGSPDSSAFAAELCGLLPQHGAAERLARTWLEADAPDFDVGGFVVGDETQEAHLLGKTSGILAGRPFAQAVCDVVGIEAEWLVEDGHEITEQAAQEKRVLAKMRGPVRRILLAERTILNIMTRASGIATAARTMSRIKAEHQWHGQVAATRKTTPGFSLVEKYAVLVGGCSTHRMTLSQMVMLKDNHIWSVGNITKAVEKARAAAGFSAKIEVECQSLDAALEACAAGAEVVMLDNYEPSALKQDAAKLKAKYPHVIIEASGGITEDTAATFFSKDVDVLSMGKLTQGYSCLDLSLKIQRAEKEDASAPSQPGQAEAQADSSM
ncbi:Nicotinate-nucleotide pyrophosphorylase carboxylating [Hondaea fermentalgiana]|uniref:Nicotinate-nucleotide pyrophosphorylase [carboxylating] n=1 Tax=Hondaea fermentalgiana TaxID=2315210 RepID=A0A2R5GTP2_9STRA|nr:Nicotinate-nucleotide pyrophosphorylase carboxylating [Hondaea fermentalgiana]|eukprot:GBG34247.1 Nicotinate-nucleotide pyrophosphorylase carboxylating [Hondaea fermentalgiana]